MSSADTRAIDCGWNGRKRDFVCTETTTVPLGWAKRTYERSFLLRSQEVLKFEEMNRLAAPSVEDVVVRLRDGRVKLGEALIVPEIGPVTAIVSLPNSRDGAPRFLFATPGRGCDADFRFFLATAPQSGEPTATLVPSRRVANDLDLEVSEPSDCADAEDRGTCTGPRAKFTVTQSLKASDRLRFLRVLVEEGKGRWVYLIGLDDRGEPPRTETLLLATDTADYSHCGEYSCQAQLVPISADVRPFRAAVEIEPSHNGYWIGGQARRAEAAKPGGAGAPKNETERWQRARLLWTESDGFVLLRAEQAHPTEHEPLVVVIDDAGQVGLQRP